MQTESLDKKLTAILLQRGMMQPDELAAATEGAAKDGVRIEKWLVDNEVVSAIDMTLAVSEYLRMPPLTLLRLSPDPALLDLVPREVLQRHHALPLFRVHNMLTLALGDPFDVAAIDEIHSLTDLDIIPVVAPENEVAEMLQKTSQDTAQGLEDILRDMSDEGDVEFGQAQEDEVSLDEMLESAEDAPVVRIVNSIMVEGIRRRASDIHIEPMERAIRLRYRIDGVLYESPSPPKPLQQAIASRLKIMANLDIAERRVPQDGRFRIRALGKEADIRLSMLPTVHGEKTVMRILDKTALAPNLSSLGLDQDAYERLMYAITQPHGMILVTGPTGSGKTTTLYSALQDLNKPGVNIITVEDPVEYQLQGINQVQVQSSVGLTFAAGLRSILRQDPDIVLVGEIRDSETASIAIQAALTGHLVLSTLHTNDAAGAVARLNYMGVEPFMTASSLVMAQAQRLYRRLCAACKQKRDFPTEVLKANRLDPAAFEGVEFYAPKGCPKCGGLGYRGRGALMEIMVVNERLRQMILKNLNPAQLAEAAMEDGMQNLRQTGFARVRDGTTCIEEVLRVTSAD